MKVVHLNVEFTLGLEFKYNENYFTVLNVYTPYKSYEQEDEFLTRLAVIQSFIEDNNCNTPAAVL